MDQELLDFFSDYKAARSVTDREHARMNAELIRKFHVPEVHRAFSERWLHSREKEEVVLTSLHGSRAELQTTGDLYGPKRYLLVQQFAQWQIEKVQRRCSACRGDGFDSRASPSEKRCIRCFGSGWVDWSG